MSLLSRLRAFLDVDPEPGPDRPHVVATAALLVLVARSDGLLQQVEVDEVLALLRSRFDLSESAAADVLARIGDAGADAADLIEALARDLDPDQRRALVAMAHRIATADGAVAEFEADLVWRIGHLLGMSDREIEAARDRSLAAG